MASSSSTFTSGAAPTAAQVNGWAQGTLGYAQVTANQGTFTTPTDLTGLSVAVTLVAGRRIRVTGQVIFTSTVGNDTAELQIREGATLLQEATATCGAANSGVATVHSSIVLAPTAGGHTYKLQGTRNSGTGNISTVANANAIAFILVEDIGAV